MRLDYSEKFPDFVLSAGVKERDKNDIILESSRFHSFFCRSQRGIKNYIYFETFPDFVVFSVGVGCVALGPKSRIIREIMKQFWSFFKKHFRNAQRRPQGVCMSSGVLGIDQNTVMRLFSQTEIFEAGKSRFPWFLTILDRKYLSDDQLK